MSYLDMGGRRLRAVIHTFVNVRAGAFRAIVALFIICSGILCTLHKAEAALNCQSFSGLLGFISLNHVTPVERIELRAQQRAALTYAWRVALRSGVPADKEVDAIGINEALAALDDVELVRTCTHVQRLQQQLVKVGVETTQPQLYEWIIQGVLLSLDPHSTLYSNEAWQELQAHHRSALIDPATSVRGGMSQTLAENSVGLLRLGSFFRGSATLVADGVRELQQQGAKSIVLDLRDNPGGYVNEAVAMMDDLLDQGVALFLEDQKRTLDAVMMRTPGTINDMPVAIMINGSSASAAELIAGGLRQYGRALLIGESSFGKGSAQLVYAPEVLAEMFDDETIDVGLRLTTYRYYFRNGHSPQRHGVLPDSVVTDPLRAFHEASVRDHYRQQGKHIFLREAEFPNALAHQALPTSRLYPYGPYVVNPIQRLLGDLYATHANMMVDHFEFEEGDDRQLRYASKLLSIYHNDCLNYRYRSCVYSEASEAQRNRYALWNFLPKMFQRRASIESL